MLYEYEYIPILLKRTIKSDACTNVDVMRWILGFYSHYRQHERLQGVVITGGSVRSDLRDLREVP
jgi:hypothetical protein